MALAEGKKAGIEGLVDPVRLGEWLDAQGIAPGAPLRLARVGEGRSNETIDLSRGELHCILRRPAALALEGADRGMQREFTVLSALEGTSVPHPSPIALCTDRAVIGAAFYLMHFVEGSPIVGDAMPEGFDRRLVALAAIDALAEVAKVDWRAQGLEGWGRPEGFHERQVARWMKQLASYESYPNRLVRELPGIREIAGWLDANRPKDWTPAITHGDYHTMNLLFAHEPPPRVTAILDWENSTIADPLLDLGGCVRILSRQSDEVRPDELVERYAERTGKPVPDLRYYSVLAAWKLAIMLEGVYQRSRGDTTREPMEAEGATVLTLLAEARELSGV